MNGSWYGFGADLLLVVHLLFILFVITGGWLVLRWPLLALLHLPAALWGTLVELAGWYCPLTDVEQSWRLASGLPSYETSFVERYLLPLIYPEHLTREIQIGLGILVILCNILPYALLLYGWRQRKRQER